MALFTDLHREPTDRPQMVSIGVFDGVHRGHQYLLQEARAQAEALGAGVTVVALWPPPLAVLRPDVAVRCLMTGEEKRAALAAVPGVTRVVIEPFTPEVAALSAAAFLARLRAALPVFGLVEGDDFVLGHDRGGTLAWLAEYAAAAGLRLIPVARQREGDAPISSTRIRGLLEAGELAAAERLLGHRYHLGGEVVHGEARGRRLGFPTANLRLDPLKLIPADGIYAARAWRAATPGEVWRGTASIGWRPTFGGRDRRVEIYLLDAAPDLYGAELRVELIQRLRAEATFASVDALVAQMARDVTETRAVLDAQESRAI